MRILITGATGMLGHTLFFQLAQEPELEVWGSARHKEALSLFPCALQSRLITDVRAEDDASVRKALQELRPDVVINAIGLIRQLDESQHPLPCITINARFPHFLLDVCREVGARLIHYSTDCVFDGHQKGGYVEEDTPTAKDLYGLTKALGEVVTAPGLTLRTSVIGHELRSGISLVEWFLKQTGPVKGYCNAIYSGLPAAEHARILIKHILPRPNLCGLYHVAGSSINKYDLLCLVNEIYKKAIVMVPDTVVVEDKQLDGMKFVNATGYQAPDWASLVATMRNRHNEWLAAM